MAEAAVNFLLNKLTSVLEDEVHLLKGVREEVVYIRDEFDHMKSFLRVADAKEETDLALKVWIRQVRDVAYDIEDVLDEYRVRLPHNCSNGFVAFPQRSFSSLAHFNVRNQIASEIKGINSRISRIAEAYQRYRSTYQVIEQDSNSTSITLLDGQGEALLLEEADLVGIDRPKQQLVEWLVTGKFECEVVSVVGMGGLGKTTLVKKVYDDVNVKKCFTIRTWATVSQSFKTKDLLKDILQQLYNALRKLVPEEVNSMNYDQLRLKIKKILNDRKYLIVLDDVWGFDAWNAVRYALPNNYLGSRVLLTTRDSEVATTACTEFPGNIYYLNPLSQEESSALFCKKIFKNDSCPPHLEKISDEILRKCEGLPLAIVAVSGVLVTKDKNIDEWEMVRRGLGAELQENDKLKNLKKILSHSYHDLPYYLKSCLLYFSIFPEGLQIEQMRLIPLWIAEGFVEEKEGHTLEEVAEGYFKKLLNRSLIQVAETTSDGKVKTCRIHDLLREIIVSKARARNFAAIAKEQNMSWPEEVRRISVHNTLQSAHHSLVVPKLRSLFMFWGMDSVNESSKLIFPSGHSPLLNVLDLQDAPFKQFPKQVSNLYLLKYLSLRNTKLKNIPSSIRKLRYLETLDLKQTHVSKLPVDILELKRLRHLLVYRYEKEPNSNNQFKYGFKAMKRIGCLQSLQKLCFIESYQYGNHIMEELGRLRQLRRLGVIKFRTRDGKALCSSIEKLKNLRAFSLTVVNKNEIIDMQYLTCPPKFLQRLYLRGRLEKLPNWISSLQGLAKLCLRWSRLTGDPLFPLHHLPNLAHLEFIQAFEGESLLFKEGGFQRLKFLGLNKLEQLKTVAVEKGALSCLEKLIVEDCGLQQVPSGIENLTMLKLLEFLKMPSNFISSPHLFGGEDNWKDSHMPEVYFTHCEDGITDDVYSLESFIKGENFLRLDTGIKRQKHKWKF
ncbi:disease resistance protein RPM1-like [Tripterygium wilfordii]|uniref:disease resistance protein RPM1-like n=1 Tax=Tripterygium wilfordii TaxID=458696 RepID=UPI0018F824AF|nr:disease resistance protein RPM1-like [Tripterygium wilfordii]XP_038726059.1 disease resistance protein RPM1-like [Tripterygium wilfordii]